MKVNEGTTRRKFTKLGLGTIAATFFNIPKKASAQKVENRSQANFITEIESFRKKFLERFGFDVFVVFVKEEEFRFSDNSRLIVAPEKDLEKLLETLNIIYNIFSSSYPNLKRVISQMVLGKTLSGYPKIFKSIMRGFAAYDTRQFFIATENFSESTIHHEVAHLVKMSKIFIKNEIGELFEFEDNWKRKIYPEDRFYKFRYSGLLNFLQDKNAKRPEGFASRYGKVNVLEDFASVAELMFDPQRFLEDPELANDKILMRKCREVARVYEQVLGVSSSIFEIRFQGARYLGLPPWM